MLGFYFSSVLFVELLEWLTQESKKVLCAIPSHGYGNESLSKR